MPRFQALRLLAGDGAPQRAVVEMDSDELSPGNVLIRVHWSSINYKDALASRGLNGIIRTFPRIGGIDLTGTVAESSDPRFQPGEAVIVHGFGIGVDHDGGHAQLARVSGDWVMKLPKDLTLYDAAVIGVAGYTAALSLHLMELNGLTPARGPVLVNGATGGVASLAIDMLAQRGYPVAALTGKVTEADYLKSLGASEVIDRKSLDYGSKPLERARWAGAVDSVGGSMLAWLTRTMQPEGVIAAFGNAGGMELQTTVLPFILRGVRLIGVNGNSPMPLREVVWAKIAGAYRPRHLQAIARTITLPELPAAMDAVLDGSSRGRVIVDLQHGLQRD